MDLKHCIKFLMGNFFFLWYRSTTQAFNQKCMFMHGNKPANASRLVRKILASKRSNGDRLIKWPPPSPDLNCIENLWSGGNISRWQEIYEKRRPVGSHWDLLQELRSLLFFDWLSPRITALWPLLREMEVTLTNKVSTWSSLVTVEK